MNKKGVFLFPIINFSVPGKANKGIVMRMTCIAQFSQFMKPTTLKMSTYKIASGEKPHLLDTYPLVKLFYNKVLLYTSTLKYIGSCDSLLAYLELRHVSSRLK